MRIVVSGTHATGKSTLINDFARANPAFEVLPDPFELLDAAPDEPDTATFSAQLRIAADRLLEAGPGASVIAERGPLDFVAYLDALRVLGRAAPSPTQMARARDLTAAEMAHVDLLVILPATRELLAPDDEDPELRQAMDEALLDLIDEGELTGTAEVVEVTGDREERVAIVEAAARRS